MATIPKNGYLYVAYREQFIKEAFTSAGSLKRVDRDSHITLITDREIKDGLFDRVIIDPVKNDDINKLKNEMVAKCSWDKMTMLALKYRIKWLGDFPYENTFFIDTDTYFYGNCRELFELLDYFDICIALEPKCKTPIYNKENNLIVEHGSNYNAGVMIYRKNSRNDFLFKNWKREYEEKLFKGLLVGWEGSQHALAQAFLFSESKLHILPYIYNARITAYTTLNAPVKIVHGRFDDYEKLRPIINTPSSHRCWDPKRKRCISSSVSTYIRCIRKIKQWTRYVSNSMKKALLTFLKKYAI